MTYMSITICLLLFQPTHALLNMLNIPDFLLIKMYWCIVWQAVPKGHPDCLTGKTFVITGSLESITRSEAEDLVKRHSGRVTGSVSGRTTFLVAGQDSGTRKIATVSAAHSYHIPQTLVTMCCAFDNIVCTYHAGDVAISALS